jgi:hypothetical protein
MQNREAASQGRSHGSGKRLGACTGLRRAKDHPTIYYSLLSLLPHLLQSLVPCLCFKQMQHKQMQQEQACAAVP